MKPQTSRPTYHGTALARARIMAID